MRRAVSCDSAPFMRMVRCLTVANTLSIGFVTGMRVPAPMSGRGFRDRGIWCDHPGQRRREHEGAGRPISYVELRARVSSWPPLRLARLRRERESVVVV
jgi:predicted transcriptional regulator